MSEAEVLWTVQDVSAFLRVPVATIYQWRVRSEGPPAMRIGRHLRFAPETVREWTRDQREAS
ncbi:helix-turn-helix domain-containing protein [Intrasporangium sp. DVR]|uniref:helix-turn-helix domain-containing protein n=1 Tax=Intrasporangium sp. DVR TaxID=3127867 RepID=UPI00313A57D9